MRQPRCVIRCLPFAWLLAGMAAGCATTPIPTRQTSPVVTVPQTGPALLLRVGMPIDEAGAALEAAGGSDFSEFVGITRYGSVDDGPPPRSAWHWYELPDGTCLNVYANEGKAGSGGPMLVRGIEVGERAAGYGDKFAWGRQMRRRVGLVDLAMFQKPPAE